MEGCGWKAVGTGADVIHGIFLLFDLGAACAPVGKRVTKSRRAVNAAFAWDRGAGGQNQRSTFNVQRTTFKGRLGRGGSG